MKTDCRNFDELPAMLGISRAGAYALLHSRGFPTLQIGKRLMVPKDKLAAWIDRSTGDG